MTWPLILLLVGVATTLTLWATFVYIAVRGTRTEIPDTSFGASLGVPQGPAVEAAAMTILLPVDGSAQSVAAVEQVAHCPLPEGSTIELLYVVHSRLPVIPDFPPWAFTIAAAHAESIREQTRRAPGVLEAAARYLQAHHGKAMIVTKTVGGVPKNVIVREAAALGADSIVLGSHGRGRTQRTILGATAAAVAAEAPCSVQIARPRPAAARHVLPGTNVA